MTRGSIFWINLEDTHPPEFGKTRPGIVVSNSIQNDILDTVVVIPLSTQPPEIWPLRIKLDPKLQERDSFAVIPGLRQVDKTRLLERVGHASPEFLQEMDEAISAYLS